MNLVSLTTCLSLVTTLAACGASSSGSDEQESASDRGLSPQPASDSGNSGNSQDIEGIKLLTGSENCGDGELTDDEVCDDGGVPGLGCFDNCLGIDQGYICGVPGTACLPFARCGDSKTSLPEQCDDGNAVSGDGCTDLCKVEVGFKCPDDGQPCSATTCGDNLVEGAETCDDGNRQGGDGCSAACVGEPNCAAGACSSECGDGLVLGGSEECDDGNTLNGDGCSAECKNEPGYACVQSGCEKSANDECILTAPVVYRDFSNEHPDFNSKASPCSRQGKNGATEGLLENTLTAGRPVLKTVDTSSCNSNFAEWFTDTPGTNLTIASQLVLYDDGAGNFVNRYGSDGTQWFTSPDTTYWSGTQECSTDPCGPYDGSPLFFPIDGVDGALDDGGELAAVATQADYGMDGQLLSEQSLTGASPKHNFGFTSEVTYWFTYTDEMKATLRFLGDDDVYVFLGGRLVVDLGGLHPAASGSLKIESGQVTSDVVNDTAANLGLVSGNVYEIKVFHAERQAEGSTFKLTLSGFDTSRSVCTPDCGDGIIAFGEECDDGVNDGGYNECQEGCVLGGYCGDGIVQEGEVCDDAAPDAPPECSGCRILVIR